MLFKIGSCEPYFQKGVFPVQDDVIKWKHFPRNWPFVRGIHRSPLNSPHKGQWRGAFMFSLICVWINDWVNNREASDLRRYRAHYDVIVMNIDKLLCYTTWCAVISFDEISGHMRYLWEVVARNCNTLLFVEIGKYSKTYFMHKSLEEDYYQEDSGTVFINVKSHIYVRDPILTTVIDFWLITS